MSNKYTYVLHKVLSFNDVNAYVTQRFNSESYLMTCYIHGNDQFNKDIFDEYPDKPGIPEYLKYYKQYILNF